MRRVTIRESRVMVTAAWYQILYWCNIYIPTQYFIRDTRSRALWEKSPNGNRGPAAASQQAANSPRGIIIKNDQHNAVDSGVVSGDRGGSGREKNDLNRD